MANIKITDLTAYTDPAATDVLPIVDVGADVTKKVSIADLFKNAASGTESLPGIAFDGDSDTGIYRPGEDQVAISTNGQGRLFIDSSGNVGIGTTSPSAKLEVVGDAKIGDTSYPLRLATSSSTGVIEFSNTSVRSVVRTLGATPLEFEINSSPVGRFDSSGRLLVGTSSARSAVGVTSAFQVEGTGYDTSSLSLICNANSAGIASNLILGKSRGTSLGSNTVVQSGDTIGDIAFAGADGSDLGQYAAKISAEVDGTPGANDMPGRLVFSSTPSGSAAPVERMRITSGGRVVVGLGILVSSATSSYILAGASSTPTGNLAFESVTGSTSLRYHQAFTNSNGVVGTITTSASATAYNTSSDYRLKENVTPVTDGITRVQQLKPSRFNFIADPDTVVDGFIAHEVQTIVPEAITGEKDAVDDDGNPVYQGIDQSKLVPLLTAALQEAIGEIESLKARVAALESA